MRPSIPLLLALLLPSTIIPTRTLVADDGDRDVAAAINRANQALRNNEIEQALAGYDAIGEPSGLLPELAYNRGVALYRGGNIDAARESLRKAASSLDASLAAKTAFNLGNCDYRQALDTRREEPEEAIARLQSAIANYRSALAIDPTDTDARANLELAARLRDELMQRKEQQQQQDQQQQDQQQQDQQQQDQQQQDQQQQDQQQQDQQQQDQQQQSQQQQEQEPPEDDQQQEKSDGGQPQDPGDRSDSSGSSEEPNSESSSDVQTAEDRQSEEGSDGGEVPDDAGPDAGGSAPDGQPEPADDQPEQDVPRGELTGANESEGDVAEQSIDRVTAATEGEMTLQEARKMLQAIRDRDMLRRLRREAAERSSRVPVERDW